MSDQSLPTIIQGGMGVGVSGWRLARAVARTGQLGVISGTALDAVMTRRLQLGDPGGHLRRALAHFPFPDAVEYILDRYFIPGGKAPDAAFKPPPFPTAQLSRRHEEFVVASNFAEVFLAKEGHGNPVGVNYLEKIQFTTLPSLYGAVLGGVDYVLMGAGIPRAIPGVLDRLVEGQPVQLALDVQDSPRDKDHFLHFDPSSIGLPEPAQLRRPKFLAIVASATLASVLLKKSTGSVDGFVIEGFTAGGHNAPPRGKMQLSEDGQPVYSERDIPDLEAIARLGVPYWLAGSFGSREGLSDALESGAQGIQVGTPFAFCEESDLDPEVKRTVLEVSRCGRARVFTDPLASPTGFPFKVVQLDDTISDAPTYDKRPRICDLAHLRQAYPKDNGELGYRCPAEPVEEYVKKGGKREDTVGRKCLCNALLANIGLGQIRGGEARELPLVTSGHEVVNVACFLQANADSYTASEVIEYLLGSRLAPRPTASAAVAR